MTKGSKLQNCITNEFCSNNFKKKGKERFGFYCPFKNISLIQPIINQRWPQIGVLGEKPPDLLVQNLASHMYPE